MNPARRSRDARSALVLALLPFGFEGCPDTNTVIVGGGGSDLNQADAAAAVAEARRSEDFIVLDPDQFGAPRAINVRDDGSFEVWLGKTDPVTGRPQFNRIDTIPVPDPTRAVEGVATPGTTDLFVQLNAGGVAWFEGLPNGSFGPTINPAVNEFIEPFNAPQLVVVDLTGDGASDLAFVQNAAAPGTDATLVVYHNNGAGAFAHAQDITIPVEIIDSLFAGDLNGDSRPDLVAATASGTFPFITQPAGTLLHLDPATGLAQPTPATPLAPATDGILVPLNGPLVRDLVLTNNTPGGITIYPSSNNGVFVNSVHLPGPVLHSPAIADFNLDGVPDVAASSQDDSIAVFFGPFTRDGAPPLALPVADSPSRLFTLDLFGSGRKDLISYHRNDNILLLLTNNAPQGFIAPTRYPLTGEFGSPLGGTHAALADVNGDDYTDLVVATQSFSLATALNKADGSGSLAPLFDEFMGLPVIAIEPLAPFEPSTDARRPIVAIFETFNEAAVLVLDSTSNPPVWSLVQLLPCNAQPLAIAVADLDGDGREDVVCTHEGGAPTISTFLQTAPAFFEPALGLDGVAGAFDRLALAHLNPDPAPDVILADASTGQLRVHLADGFGGFNPSPASTHSLTPPLSNIALADINDDNRPDVLVACGAGAATSINILHSLASGALAPTAALPAPRDVRAILASDMTRDGLPDLAILHAPANPFGSALIRVVLNNNGVLDPAFYPSGHFAHADPVWFARADLHNPATRAASAPETIILAGDAPFPHDGITVLPGLDFPPAPCPGDANGDRVVNFLDLNIVLSFFGAIVPPGTSGDLNNDGAVNFLDLNIVLSFFGESC